MPSADNEYQRLVATLTADTAITSGQMFGKACLKVGGKAFVSLHNDQLVFKLTGEPHRLAMAQPGAGLWDPSGKGRPMKQWVAVPASAARHFQAFAAAALDHVSGSGEGPGRTRPSH